MRQYVGRRLRHEDAQAGLFTNRFLFIESEIAEHVVLQRFPELIHEVNERTPVDERFSDMKQIRHDRRPDLRIIEKFCVVIAEEVAAGEVLGVLRIVKGPGEWLIAAP